MNFKKYFLSGITILFILLLSYSLYSYSTGFTGVTKKTGGAGCICHGNFAADTSLSVTITGPDSLVTGQSAIYKLTIKGGPHITGGFDIASDSGSVDTSYTDTGVKKLDNELTHNIPRNFTGDSVVWSFKYTAPQNPLSDTLYSVGNSTNNDGAADTNDAWNFSTDKIIRIYIPIGIKTISNGVPENFYLYQNYPNPFNPTTKIRFQLPKYQAKNSSDVVLNIYNSVGQRMETLINGRLQPGSYEITWNANQFSSGIYFYSVKIDGTLADTKRMILIK